MKITTSEFKAALRFVKKAHKGQFRKDGKTPYYKHPLGVAKLLAQKGIKTYLMLTAALLHDVIEDTEYTYEDIYHEFGGGVAEVVELLTRSPNETYYDFIYRIGESGNIYALEIKIHDIIHNMSDLEECSLKDKYRFALDLLEKARFEL
jgi:GTP pyrophosphokinase